MLAISIYTIYPLFSHKMEYVEATDKLNIQYQTIDYNYSREELKAKVEDLVGVKFYFYKDNPPKDNNGYTLLPIRVVYIDEALSDNDYIEALCHELTHLKYNTRNDRFTQYQTFITLYNSEFRQVALNIAYGLENGYYTEEYNCYAQIVDFL